MKHPSEAPKGSFWHRRSEYHSQGRLRIDVITFEEGVWLILGIIFGWFAGKGAPLLLLLIPIVLFGVWFYEFNFAKKHGVRTIHNKLIRSKL